MSQAIILPQYPGDFSLDGHTHSQYLTSHQSLTNYATKTYVTNQLAALDVASSSHNHDSSYASKSHTHSYASTSHTHDYASSSHTHSGYASSSHNHSGYALSSHTHEFTDIGGNEIGWTLLKTGEASKTIGNGYNEPHGSDLVSFTSNPCSVYKMKVSGKMTNMQWGDDAYVTHVSIVLTSYPILDICDKNLGGKIYAYNIFGFDSSHGLFTDFSIQRSTNPSTFDINERWTAPYFSGHPALRGDSVSGGSGYIQYNFKMATQQTKYFSIFWMGQGGNTTLESCSVDISYAIYGALPV